MFLSAIALFIFSLPAWCEAAKAQSAKPAVPALSDAALQQKIQDKFSRAKAGGGKFTVRVQSGVAYLNGRADVIQHKAAATRMAKSSGAKRVVNNIQISEAAKQKASRQLHEGKPRQAQIKTQS